MSTAIADRGRDLALRALEDGLEQFAGCAVVISHDRWFLDRIATHILAFEGDSKVTFFDGRRAGGGWAARRGLHNHGPKLRGAVGGCVMPRDLGARCPRHFSEYEEWLRSPTIVDTDSEGTRTGGVVS